MASVKELDVRSELIKKIESRLHLGADRYGGPLPLYDGRDFYEETLEEVLDAIIYLTAYLIKLKHERKKYGKSK